MSEMHTFDIFEKMWPLFQTCLCGRVVSTLGRHVQ